MNASKIRGFLIQAPKPNRIRVTGDGEPEYLRPGRSYARMADSILAMNVDLVECLDKDNQVLRAMRLDSEDAQRSAEAPMPEALKADPQALMITHFANLLHRAYEHSSEIAFTKLVDLVERMGDRAEGIEARLERTEAANRRLLAEQVEQAFERAAEQQEQGQGGMLEQMASAFMSGSMQQQAGTGGASKRPNGQANGKAARS